MPAHEKFPAIREPGVYGIEYRSDLSSGLLSLGQAQAQEQAEESSKHRIGALDGPTLEGRNSLGQRPDHAVAMRKQVVIGKIGSRESQRRIEESPVGLDLAQLVLVRGQQL